MLSDPQLDTFPVIFQASQKKDDKIKMLKWHLSHNSKVETLFLLDDCQEMMSHRILYPLLQHMLMKGCHVSSILAKLISDS